MNPATWIDYLRRSGVHVTDTTVLSGGSTGTVYSLETADGPLVAKIADHTFLDAEYDGLLALKSAGVKSPDPILLLKLSDQKGCLVMSFIQQDRRGSPRNWDDLLYNLKILHSKTNDQFGWHRSNYIGKLDQHNEFNRSWESFFFDCRLDWQLKEGIKEGRIPSMLEKEFGSFRERNSQYLDIRDSPSLIHGDLWSGNFMFDVHGKAFLIDPSISFGHWEVDIAMMKLFGGFPEDVVRDYISSRGAYYDDTLKMRLKIYQLYYLIVHLRMFGKSYLEPVRTILSI